MLLAVRHVPERLCGGFDYLGAVCKCLTLYQKLAANRTQLYSMQVSGSRKLHALA